MSDFTDEEGTTGDEESHIFCETSAGEFTMKLYRVSHDALNAMHNLVP